jgi:HSP20 family protein
MTNMVKKENGRQPAIFGSVIDQVFQSNLPRFLDDDFWGFNGKIQRNQVPVNIRETEKSFEVEIMAPGFQKQDFHLNLAANTLTVSCGQQQEKKEENANNGWIKQEFKKTFFSRDFTIDDSIEAGSISARYENGILYLTLPKSEKAQQLSRVIEIS